MAHRASVDIMVSRKCFIPTVNQNFNSLVI